MRSVCLALGVLQIFIITWPQPHLIVFSDSIGYLGPAVDALEGGHFTHWRGRAFVYPLFLLGVLGVAPEPLAIVYAQRVLVVVTYTALAYSVWLLTRLAQQKRLASRPILTVLAGFWLLTYVAYPPAVILAHAVMAECMFSALVALVLLCVVVVALPETSLKRRRCALALAAIFSVALVFVKPHWLAAGLLLPVLMLGLVPSGQRRAAFGWFLVPLLLAMIAFAVPEKLLQERYDAYTSKVFAPRSLFCNSADLIYDDLAHHAHDSSANQLRELLGEVVSPTQPTSKWPWLGFDGDKCMYGAAGKWVAEKYSGDASAETAYYWQAYLGAILRQPDYLFKRVGRQFLSLASRPLGKTDASYVANTRLVLEYQEKHQFYRTWMARYRTDLFGVVESPFARYQVELKVLYFLAGLALLMNLALAAFRLIADRSAASDKKPFNRMFLSILMLCFAINCLIAIVHTFDISRYVEMQMPLFSLLGLLASIVALRTPLAAASSSQFLKTG